MDTKTINGFDVDVFEHRNFRIPTHARKFAAALDRDHHAVHRIDYSIELVTVWMDDDAPRSSFEAPDGWELERAGVYGGAVALDFKRAE
jgi:hypothetical protein